MSEVTVKTVTVGKKPISEKQRLANVENSKRSSGPRTEAGKNACKYNGKKHGMRADTILPGEGEEYASRFSKWSEEWSADTDSQRFLVHRAVMASLKLDRGDIVEEALTDKLQDDAVEGADDRDADELDRLIGQLADSPAATIRRIRKSPTGCLWIRAQWLILLHRLETHRSLLNSQRRQFLFLLGRRIEDFLRDDMTIIPLVLAMAGALFSGMEEVDLPSIAVFFGGQPEGMTTAEFENRLKEVAISIPEGKQANLMLRAHVAAELEKLKEHLELVEALAARDRARDGNAALIALNPAGKQLEGYVTTQRQSFDAALRRLDVMQNPRRPRPGRGPGPGPGPGDGKNPGQTDPGAATVDLPAADTTATEGRAAEATPTGLGVAASGLVGVSTEGRGAVATDAASGEREPLVETLPELPAMTETEATGESAIEPEGDEITSGPISAGEPRSQPEVDEITTGPISAGEPTMGTIRGAGPARPLAKTFKPVPAYRGELPEDRGVMNDGGEAGRDLCIAPGRTALGGGERPAPAGVADDASDAAAARSPPGGAELDR